MTACLADPAALVDQIFDTLRRAASSPPRMLLTDSECGEVLRCGKTRVRELLKSGEIPSVLIGGTMLRVRLRDLEAYIASLPARGGEVGREPCAVTDLETKRRPRVDPGP